MNARFVLFKKSSNKDYPIVIINDLLQGSKLSLALGQWLGLLSKEASISEAKEKAGLITSKFGKILKKSGISKEEICFLSSYKSDEHSFNCYFRKAKKRALMKLEYGMDIDVGPTLTAIYKDCDLEYEYFPGDKETPMCLYRSSRTLSNPINGNRLYHELTPVASEFMLVKGDYALTVNSNRCKGSQGDICNEWNYLVDKEFDDKLETYLINLDLSLVSKQELISMIYKLAILNADTTAISIINKEIVVRINAIEKTIDITLNGGKNIHLDAIDEITDGTFKM